MKLKMWNVRRELVSGKLPKDGYLLGDVEMRHIIESFAEDEAIFFAVRTCAPQSRLSTHTYSLSVSAHKQTLKRLWLIAHYSELQHMAWIVPPEKYQDCAE